MTQVLDIISLWTAVLLGLLMAVLLAPHHRKHINLRFLNIFFGLNLFLIVFFYLFRNQFIDLSPYVYYAGWSVFFLLGPFLFFYLRALCQPETPWKTWILPHLIAFPVSLSILSIDYFLRSGSGDSISWWGTTSKGIAIAMQVSIGIYVFVIFRELIKHQALLKEHFSNTDQLDLAWFTGILVVFVVHWLFDSAGLALGLMGVQSPEVHALLSSFAIGIFAIFAIAVVIRGLYQQPIKPEALPLADSAVQRATEEFERTQEHLLAFMEQDQPFLDPELTLDQLAAAMGVPAKHLSRCLNLSLQKNFFDFINGYRLGKAKHMLASKACKEKNISEILFDSGFNSKATFNRIFKKQVGMTPTQYRKKEERRSDNLSPEKSQAAA